MALGEGAGATGEGENTGEGTADGDTCVWFVPVPFPCSSACEGEGASVGTSSAVALVALVTFCTSIADGDGTEITELAFVPLDTFCVVFDAAPALASRQNRKVHTLLSSSMSPYEM